MWCEQQSCNNIYVKDWDMKKVLFSFKHKLG